MSLLFHDTELMELMQAFHRLTGIRIILFDENCTELLSYPDHKATFCECMRRNEQFDEKCRICDRNAMEQARKGKKLYVYKCHAGFIEATTPITEDERIIGYMMFGQITDNKNKTDFFREMTELCRSYGMDGNLAEQIRQIKYRSEKQILAAAKILDACTGYIQMKEYVHSSGRDLIDSIGQFVKAHIAEDIDVARLCREFHISRTRLYDLTRQYVGGGIATFVRKKRLEHAKKLLKSTDMSIAQVADATGFDDYNYFLRVFKKEFGIPPRAIRKPSEPKNP